MKKNFKGILKGFSHGFKMFSPGFKRMLKAFPRTFMDSKSFSKGRGQAAWHTLISASRSAMSLRRLLVRTRSSWFSVMAFLPLGHLEDHVVVVPDLLRDVEDLRTREVRKREAKVGAK